MLTKKLPYRDDDETFFRNKCTDNATVYRWAPADRAAVPNSFVDDPTFRVRYGTIYRKTNRRNDVLTRAISYEYYNSSDERNISYKSGIEMVFRLNFLRFNLKKTT